jgi:hypothetical protein
MDQSVGEGTGDEGEKRDETYVPSIPYSLPSGRPVIMRKHPAFHKA